MEPQKNPNLEQANLENASPNRADRDSEAQLAAQDLGELPAVEIITLTLVHLMSAAAVKCGLAEDQPADLDEARKLITVLAAATVAAAPEIGGMHASSLRDGVKALQLAFREASTVPDPVGQGPGEKYTGPVN